MPMRNPPHPGLSVRRCFKGELKPPFNREARAAAGFPAHYWETLAAGVDK